MKKKRNLADKVIIIVVVFVSWSMATDGVNVYIIIARGRSSFVSGSDFLPKKKWKLQSIWLCVCHSGSHLFAKEIMAIHMALRVSLWQSSRCQKKKNRNGARQRSLRSRFKLFTKLQTARHSLAAERNKRLRLHLYIWSNCVEWLMCLSYFQVYIVWQKLKKKKKVECTVLVE